MFDPDILAADLDVVFCGINPATTALSDGHNFSSPSNRFWKVLHLAGFTPVTLDAAQERDLLGYRCGITAAIARATPRAQDLSRAEIRDAIPALESKIRENRPRVTAFLGQAVYAIIAGQRSVPWGRQPSPFAGSVAWVLPNPSGLNRNFSLADLVTHYAVLHLAIARS